MRPKTILFKMFARAVSLSLSLSLSISLALIEKDFQTDSHVRAPWSPVLVLSSGCQVSQKCCQWETRSTSGVAHASWHWASELDGHHPGAYGNEPPTLQGRLFRAGAGWGESEEGWN